MSQDVSTTAGLYGLLAEFESADALAAAASRAHKAGYTRLDAFSPVPIDGLAEAIGQDDRRVQRFVLLGGIVGGLSAFALQYWISVIDYPLNVGGRPLNSWPAFIVPTFELTILFASFTALFVMLGLNGLPQPYHPVFNVPSFARASSDGYFLSVEAEDPKFDRTDTRRYLESLGATEVNDIEP